MKRILSNGGSPIKEIREPFVNKDGSIDVRVTGKESLQDYIQSFKDSCNVEYLVKRAVNGDIDALNQRSGSYGDFTEMPKTLAEAIQRVIDAQSFFDTLSPDVKAGFDNDFNKFLAQSMDVKVLESVGLIKPVEKSDFVEKGVNEVES